MMGNVQDLPEVSTEYVLFGDGCPDNRLTMQQPQSIQPRSRPEEGAKTCLDHNAESGVIRERVRYTAEGIYRREGIRRKVSGDADRTRIG